jgi:uncharacterized protein (DUF885 family)
MLANSGMSKTDATAGVERYIAIASQALAYKIGALTIQRLKAKAQEGVGRRDRLEVSAGARLDSARQLNS